MGNNALRVLEWLDDVQYFSRDADVVATDAQNFIRTVPASPLPESQPIPITPELKSLFTSPAGTRRDDSKDPEIDADTKHFIYHGDEVQNYAPESFLVRAQSQLGVARMRELGLIAVEDCDRLSNTKVAECACADEQASRNEDPWLPAALLCKIGVPDLSSKLALEGAPKVSLESDGECLDKLRRQGEGTQRSSNPSSQEIKDLDCKHATASYQKEARESSLLTDNGVDGEKLCLAERADKTKPKDFHVYIKEHRHILGLSSKPSCIISVNFGANNDKRAQQPNHEGISTANPPIGPLKFQRPDPPGNLVFEKTFDLTLSEASAQTAESFCTGDGEFVKLHNSEAGKTSAYHGLMPHPSTQTAHIEGALGKDGDIQVPIFPYPHLATRCRAISCPVKGKHEMGPYLHEGKLRARDGNIFGASNPPQEIWEAYDRIKDDDNSLGGKGKDKVAAKDVKLVTRFARLHFGEATEWSLVGSEAEDGIDRYDRT